MPLRAYRDDDTLLAVAELMNTSDYASALELIETARREATARTRGELLRARGRIFLRQGDSDAE